MKITMMCRECGRTKKYRGTLDQIRRLSRSEGWRFVYGPSWGMVCQGCNPEGRDDGLELLRLEGYTGP